MDFLKKLTSKKKSKSSTQKTQQQPKLPEAKPASKPKGILKNKNDTQKYNNTDAYPTSDDIDESLRNAQKNSSLNQSLYGTVSNTPQNEEAKDNDTKSDDNAVLQKDLKWDEQNLEKNEREKVPRMKIDEPPTPYAELPIELQNDLELDNDVEEIILDENPMEMSLDDDYQPDLESNPSNDTINNPKTLDQKQQALLLADDEYRQQMVNDAMNRREENNEKQSAKKVVSAWEDDMPKIETQSTSPDNEIDSKKERFKKKRKAHYNEYHAIRAWKAKQSNDDGDDLNK